MHTEKEKVKKGFWREEPGELNVCLVRELKKATIVDMRLAIRRIFRGEGGDRSGQVSKKALLLG